MTENIKHIVFVSHTRALHGSEQVMLTTIRQCIAQGWKVTVVLPQNKPNEGLENALGKEIDILYLNYTNSGGGLLRTVFVELYNLPAVFRLSRWIRKNKVDLVYSNTSVTLLGVEAAHKAKIPHVWHWHELPSKEFGWSKSAIIILRYWRKYNHRILFISQNQKSLWEKCLGNHRIANTQVLYNPIRTIRTQRSEHEGGIRIGYVGGFNERKNLPWLIQTVERLTCKYNVHLFLYGAKDEKEKVYMQSFINNTKVLSVYEYTTDIESVYANLDIFVLPSWSETMPLVVLEAMQAGVCVLQTNHSGMTELMHDNKECLFVSPENPESLYQALIRCMDKSLRTEIATRGQEFAKEWMIKNKYQQNIISIFNCVFNEY